MATPIRHLRWYIGGLLFLSTVINYIDRQTLSVLAPYIKTEFHWSNTDFAFVIIAFRAAYAKLAAEQLHQVFGLEAPEARQQLADRGAPGIRACRDR